MLAMRGDLGRLVKFIQDAELRPEDVAAALRRLIGRRRRGRRRDRSARPERP